jgi:hypothetical protein
LFADYFWKTNEYKFNTVMQGGKIYGVYGLVYSMPFSKKVPTREEMLYNDNLDRIKVAEKSAFLFTGSHSCKYPSITAYFNYLLRYPTGWSTEGSKAQRWMNTVADFEKMFGVLLKRKNLPEDEIQEIKDYWHNYKKNEVATSYLNSEQYQEDLKEEQEHEERLKEMKKQKKQNQV